MHELDCTVVGVATPPGRGGIACVRFSGSAAERIASNLFRPQRDAPAPGGPPRFGRFVGADGQPIDHGYLVLFGSPHTYTGEPIAEAWTHGSTAVLDELIRAAVAAGAMPAGPGEFTYRAVRNGRLDLARAEAVRDLIVARTRHQARVALAQAEGALSRRVAPVREILESWIARAEAAVEFVDESATGLEPDALRVALAGARADCAKLLSGFSTGRVVREGAQVVLIGRPNVGKSSLFNRLVEQERAIVTAVPGTTRDTLDAACEIDGIPVRLIDTAGLRPVDDPVEREGVRRALEARADADLVLLVLDPSRALAADEETAVGTAQSASDLGRTIVVWNKADLGEAAGAPPTPPALSVSAKTGVGIASLRGEIGRRLVRESGEHLPLVTNARHALALEDTLAGLDRALGAIDLALPEELVIEDLREARHALGSITGEFSNEALYDRVFSEFCIGK